MSIKASDVKPGVKLMMADGTFVSVIKVHKAERDRLFERAGGWANALEIRWKGGWTICDSDDVIKTEGDQS